MFVCIFLHQVLIFHQFVLSQQFVDMSDEALISSATLSLVSVIETCSKEVTDLKISMVQSFSSIEKEIGHLNSSYKMLVNKIDVLEKAMKVSPDCENHHHQCCKEVLSKINSVEQILKSFDVDNRFDNGREAEDSIHDKSHSPVILLRNNKPAQVSASVSLDSSVQVITLNSESDFPDGSWLGDETNIELRVRCPISPSNLLHINTFCETPERMAVTLLDYLFARDVLAVSNLSGKGKHGKKQLDPLMIYGIRCHLLHKFNINERDWYRIKQNIDSKCRTAWRKKVKGLPMRRSKNSESNNAICEFQEIVTDDGQMIILTDASCRLGTPVEAMDTQVIHTNEGDIKVLHATPDQILRIQEGSHIQVLSEDLILPVLRDYSQLLVGDEDDMSSGQILTVGSGETTLTVPSSEMNIDTEVDINSSQFIEVQDSSMSSQVL